MPKITKAKIKMRDPSQMTEAFYDAIAEALSEYFQRIYPLVVAYAPKEKISKDPRRKPGIVARSIQLMDAEFMGRRYITIGVPGASVPNSDPYRAMLAIQSKHFGWKARGVIEGKPILTFPVTVFQRGGRGKSPPSGQGPKRWVVTQRVDQTGTTYPMDPWIHKIITMTLPLWEEIINRKLQQKMIEVPEKKVI